MRYQPHMLFNTRGSRAATWFSWLKRAAAQVSKRKLMVSLVRGNIGAPAEVVAGA